MNIKKPPIHRIVAHGMTVLVIEDHSLPIIDFALLVRKGAGHDPVGKAGLLHIYLDMLLRGSAGLSHNEFAMRVERIGSDLDTAIGLEAAGFRGACLRQHADETMSLLQQAMSSPSMDQNSFQQLCQEYCENLRTERDEDDAVADLWMTDSLYEGHPFARGTGGLYKDIANLSLDDVIACGTDFLSCPDVVFAIAGDVTAERALAWSKDLSCIFSSGHENNRTVISNVVMHEGSHVCVIDRPGRNQAQLRLGFLHDACMGDAGLAFWLGCVAFAGTFSSPFCAEIRDKRGWSYTANGGTRRWSRFPVPLVLRSAPKVSDLRDCTLLELELLKDFCTEGPRAEHIEAARSYVLGRYPFELVNGADLLHPMIDLELLGRPIEELFDLPQRFACLDVENVSATVRDYARSDAFVLTIVAPRSEVSPWIDDLGARIAYHRHDEGLDRN